MLPLNPSQLPRMYREANALLQKGQPKDALEIYRRIIAANPKIAEVHFQCGKVYLKALQFGAAAEAFGKAAELKPGEPEIWKGYTEALIRHGEAEETRKALALLEEAPLDAAAKTRIRDRLTGGARSSQVKTGDVPRAALQEIIGLLNARKPGAAESKLRPLIRRHGNLAVLHTMLGTALNDQGKPEAALAAFRKAVSIDPDYPEANLLHGKCLMGLGDFQGAIVALEKARSLTPRSAPVLTALGQSYFEAGKRDMALDVLDKAVKADPKNPEAFYSRAQAAERNNDHPRALKDLGRCLALGMRSGKVYLQRSKVLAAMGETEAALEAVDKAIELMPGNGNALGNRATILQSMGDFEAADATFREAFETAPGNGMNYRIYSASHKFTEDDPLIAQMEEVFARDDLGRHDRMQLGFALSKAMEDVKRYDRVFPYLDEASRLMRSEYDYDIAQRREEIDRMKAAFAGFRPDGHPVTGSSDYAPIFVTGMPRSGTTLVEQILSSHSTVTGAGEIGRFSRESYRVMLPPEGDRHIDMVEPAEIEALAKDYEGFMRGLFPESDRVTDKSIQTYFVMGLVWLALPRARVVVVRRDPRDNLLSVYKNVFPEGTHLYSYDLGDLGKYYRMFVEMVDFWREIAPDRFHEIWYEDLIANPEEESRKLVAACDLEWEDACLNFHQNKRRVDTLSVYQVRQPIYRSSLKAWQRYETELQPLFESLGELAEPRPGEGGAKGDS